MLIPQDAAPDTGRPMYESHFHLQTRPFVAAPLVENYVPAQAMEQARQSLIRCVERAEGPGLIVGPTGSGKSLLSLLVADHFRREQFQVAMLASARLSTRRALLQNILFELHLPYRGMEEGELRLSLIDHLEPRGSGLAGLLLVLDEAHRLPIRLLEEIRLISNFIRDGQPRVRLVLAGSAELEERLASPKLESLQQRIASRCYLQSLGREETSQFIRQQLERAGGNGNIFTSDALRAVYSATDGIPRLVNQVCDHALVLAALSGELQISAAAVGEAWSDLQQLPAPWQMATPKDNEATSTAIEFGQLSDEESAAVQPESEHSSTNSRVELTLDRIDQTLGALDSADGIEFSTLGDLYEDAQEFEPVGDANTQVELSFLTPANPFGEGFDEEEVVVDRYATMAANHVSDLIDQQDGTDEIADQILALARQTAEIAQAGAETAEQTVIDLDISEPAETPEPLRVHVEGRETRSSFDPASDPVLPEEPSVSRRDVPRRESPAPRPKRREYRTLFSTLRNR
jgi:type II secretory pathway predicted ATPase ExeA